MQKENESNVENDVRKLLFGGGRKVFHAGLGAVMLAQEELSDFGSKLIERGETTQAKGRQRFDDFVAERRKNAEKATKRAEKDMDKQLERFLHRLNIPTRSEIKSLNASISRLSKKVDQLKKTSA